MTAAIALVLVPTWLASALGWAVCVAAYRLLGWVTG